MIHINATLESKPTVTRAGEGIRLQGFIRMAVPTALISSNMFAPPIEQYAVKFPLVSLEIEHCEDRVDLKRENIDLQLLSNTKKVVNEDYVQQTLLPYPRRLVASPDYLATALRYYLLFWYEMRLLMVSYFRYYPMKPLLK